MTRLIWVTVLVFLAFVLGCDDGSTAVTPPGNSPSTTSTAEADLPSPNSVTTELTDPTSQAPVSWGAALDRTSLGAGDTALLVVRAKILDGWHIYAATGDVGVGTKTNLKLTLPEGLSEVGEWTTPVADVKESPLGRISHHKKLATFSIPVKVSGEAAAQEASIVCDVDFQSCTDTSCLPPSSQQLTIPVSVTN